MSVQRVKKGTLHTDCELSSATVSSDSIFPMSCQRPQPLCTQEVCVSCFYNHVMLVTLTWMLTNPWGLLSPWEQKLWYPQVETLFSGLRLLVPLLVFRLLLGARECIMSMPTGKEEQSCVCARGWSRAELILMHSYNSGPLTPPRQATGYFHRGKRKLRK